MENNIYRKSLILCIGFLFIGTISLTGAGGITENGICNNQKETDNVFDLSSDCPAIEHPYTNDDNEPRNCLFDRVELHYYVGSSAWTQGNYAGVKWEAAIRFTSEELEPYDGWELRTVKFDHHNAPYQQDFNHNGTVYIYDEGTSSSPGGALAQKDFYVDVQGWFSVDLLEPVTINASRDLWVSVETTPVEDWQEDGYMSLDGGPGVDQKSRWVNYNNGAGWHQHSRDVNWRMGAIVFSGGPETIIQEIKGGFGKVSAVIENSGEVDATDVNWSISVKGGILGLIDISTESTIPMLNIGDTKTVQTDKLIFGLGEVDIIIEATYALTWTGTGLVFGPFIIKI